MDVRINNTQTAHSGSVYSRDYVIDYTSLERDDLIGNTRYYTKANGQSYAELTYDAWGMPESPNKLLNNDHGNYVYATYTGHIFDTTLDIYFAEARFYDANTRTWLAMDPIKSGGNWYQYCYSSPVVYYDPDGESALAILALLAKPVLAALGGMAIGGVVGAGSTLITELTDEAPGVNWRTVGENALRVAGDGGFLGIAYYISPISATIGLGSQFVADMIAGGQLSSLESYTGSAFGSSIGNLATAIGGPIIGATMGSAVATFTGQELENFWGVNDRNQIRILFNTALSGYIGFKTGSFMYSKVASSIANTTNFAFFKYTISVLGNKGNILDSLADLAAGGIGGTGIGAQNIFEKIYVPILKKITELFSRYTGCEAN